MATSSKESSSSRNKSSSSSSSDKRIDGNNNNSPSSIGNISSQNQTIFGGSSASITLSSVPEIAVQLQLPPPQQQQQQVAGLGGSSGDQGTTSGARRKRRRESEGGSSSGGDKRGKGELDAPKNTEPVCAICSKKFGSWKGYFGHLRAHPEREWRGAFPPPRGGNWSSSTKSQGQGEGEGERGISEAIADVEDQRKLLEQELAPTLVKLAEKTLAKIRAETGASQESVVPSTSLPVGPSIVIGRSVPKFDLNLLPPPEEEEEEEKEEEKDDNSDKDQAPTEEPPKDYKGKGKAI